MAIELVADMHSRIDIIDVALTNCRYVYNIGSHVFGKTEVKECISKDRGSMIWRRSKHEWRSEKSG